MIFGCLEFPVVRGAIFGCLIVDVRFSRFADGIDVFLRRLFDGTQLMFPAQVIVEVLKTVCDERC